MIRWFTGLPTRQKVYLFLSGGMLTLVFDAFIAHFSWNSQTMRWTQAVPVVYGLLAATGLFAAAIGPRNWGRGLLNLIAVLGILIGAVGVVLHGIPLIESLEGETLTIKTIGQALNLAPPLFAPGAFSGVGFLLLTLPYLLRERQGIHDVAAQPSG
jgi:TRAP-type C4-dicarboxylate transport system permease small subunit